MYIIPAEERHLESDFNLSALNLSFIADWANETDLFFQLDFADPFAISPLMTYDEIVLHFKEPSRPSVFSLSLGQPIHESCSTISS